MPNDLIRSRTSALYLAVPLADEITGSVSVCECLDDLLHGASPSRMLGHIKMQQLAVIVFS
jgi:hypothetical protein